MSELVFNSVMIYIGIGTTIMFVLAVRLSKSYDKPPEYKENLEKMRDITIKFRERLRRVKKI